MVASIYLAEIYFTDASVSKMRPVLLIKQNSFGDFLFMPLTSNQQTNGTLIGNDDLSEGFLPKTSVVVYEKASVLDKTLLVKKLGVLKPKAFAAIVDAWIQFIKS